MDNEELQEVFGGGAAVNAAGEFEILAITAGVGNGWTFSPAVLQDSLPLWQGVQVFVDHSKGARSVRDLAGVLESVAWDEEAQGIKGKLSTVGPSGPMLEELGRRYLSAGGSSRPKIGFSADVVFQAEGKKIVKIVRVNSLDLVYSPARGGQFVRTLNAEELSPSGAARPSAVSGQLSARKEVHAETQRRGDSFLKQSASQEGQVAPLLPVGSTDAGREAEAADMSHTRLIGGFGMEEKLQYVVDAQLSEDLEAARTLLAIQQEKDKLVKEAEAAREIRLQMCEYLLESGLAASRLPAPMQEHVRAQFAGKVFEATELASSLDSARVLVGQLQAASVVAGPGRISGMFNTADQLQAAVSDLFEVARDKGTETLKVARLSGIRELYMTLTGDFDLHGGYFPQQAQLATTADFTGLVANVLNKIVCSSWDSMGDAGYNWWQKIVTQESFQSLNAITGILVGTVGDLPEVAEGGEYTELAVGDSPETGSFKKYGGYVPLTLELIDRDNTRKLKAYAKELGNAGMRKISSLVAAIFSGTSGAGPLMADGGRLFNATAVTTAGGHANLLTTALSSAQWDTVGTAIYNQPALIKNATGLYGTGPKLGINPKYLLVPRALMITAMQVLYPSLERASQIYTQNQQQGQPGDVVVVPDWTDANDWAAAVDPRILPAIFVGERFGIRPEIFIAGDNLSPAVFMNDESRLKVRHFLAVWVNDFRPLANNHV